MDKENTTKLIDTITICIFYGIALACVVLGSTRVLNVESLVSAGLLMVSNLTVYYIMKRNGKNGKVNSITPLIIVSILGLSLGFTGCKNLKVNTRPGCMVHASEICIDEMKKCIDIEDKENN